MAENNKPIFDPSPCKNCTTVRSTIHCESKACTRWKNWFMRNWDYACEYLRAHLKEDENETQNNA